ncbi:MAG: 2-hydroxyacyl-CoA dehydratase [Candidatus Tectomicrobia bacterium]|uniref:2-hydroxyacyl-CoA dehydratase n=1 Tax=Tectimicrobiota bacterium TaxID=2528274 RepID=A0A932G0V9_UNCTE|nr:2-hydroxyacyl-CoA dehydratase [Candidatus Tectomicrobia bacterium]
MDWMAEEHGAAIVMDTFNALASSEGMTTEDPIDYLARASYRGYLARTSYGDMAAGGTVKDVIQMCKEYRADGVIFFAHFACKQYCGMLRLYADGIREEAGIPTLTLDGDLLDPRVVSGAQMRNRLNEFFLVLAG